MAWVLTFFSLNQYWLIDWVSIVIRTLFSGSWAKMKTLIDFGLHHVEHRRRHDFCCVGAAWGRAKGMGAAAPCPPHHRYSAAHEWRGVFAHHSNVRVSRRNVDFSAAGGIVQPLKSISAGLSVHSQRVCQNNQEGAKIGATARAVD